MFAIRENETCNKRLAWWTEQLLIGDVPVGFECQRTVDDRLCFFKYVVEAYQKDNEYIPSQCGGETYGIRTVPIESFGGSDAFSYNVPLHNPDVPWGERQSVPRTFIEHYRGIHVIKVRGDMRARGYDLINYIRGGMSALLPKTNFDYLSTDQCRLRDGVSAVMVVHMYVDYDEKEEDARYDDEDSHRPDWGMSYGEVLSGFYGSAPMPDGRYSHSLGCESEECTDKPGVSLMNWEIQSRRDSGEEIGAEGITIAQVEDDMYNSIRVSLGRHYSTSNGIAILSSNMGSPPSQTPYVMGFVDENHERFEYDNMVVLRPLDMATNPNEGMHDIDSVVVVKDGVKE